MGVAARSWAEQLGALAIPEPILRAAPVSPWGYDVGLFARVADLAVPADTPSHETALEALPAGGSVLDVGCGAGAASLPLVPRAGTLIGVDESPEMLAELASRAETREVFHEQIEGRWPDVAAVSPAADVVVCHNVLYNVADLLPFVEALTDHARRRVVVELTDVHPLAWTTPYWQALHGLERPAGPTAADAADVIRETGADVQERRWAKPSPWELEGDELVAFVRRRLCLPTSRDPDIRSAVADHPPPRERLVATLWWDVELR